MARPRGSKDKAPRRKRMSLMQKTKLAIGGGLATIGLGTAAIVGDSRRKMADLEKRSRRMSSQTDEIISRSMNKPLSTPKASGYKGLSRVEKTAKVRRRQAVLRARKPPVPTGNTAQLSRSLRAITAKAAAKVARRKLGVNYSDTCSLVTFQEKSMEFIGDRVAEFKRGKDKKPRKKRNPYVQSAAYGVLGGTAVDTGSRIGQVMAINKQAKSRFVKTGKMASARGLEKMVARSGLIGPKSNVRSLKAYGAGAAVGLGGYSAYRLAKRLRDRKRGK